MHIAIYVYNNVRIIQQYLWMPLTKRTLVIVPVAWSVCWLNVCVQDMMTSSNGNIFRVTGLLCGEFTGHLWFPLKKASDAELWCFLWSAFEQSSKQLWCWWFETPSCSWWRHRKEYDAHRVIGPEFNAHSSYGNFLCRVASAKLHTVCVCVNWQTHHINIDITIFTYCSPRTIPMSLPGHIFQ